MNARLPLAIVCILASLGTGMQAWGGQGHRLVGNFQTSFWHYVNIPPNASAHDRDRDCPRQPGVAAGAQADAWRGWAP